MARASWRRSLSRSLNLEDLTEKARSGAARMFGAGGGGGGEDLRRQDLNDTQSRLRFARIPRDQVPDCSLQLPYIVHDNKTYDSYFAHCRSCRYSASGPA